MRNVNYPMSWPCCITRCGYMLFRGMGSYEAYRLKLNIFLPYFKQVLMLIDASFGFEMETFEFLNICQVHGFPKIMGVLTHLDSFKNNKQLRKVKKRLKHRFWTEVYQVSYKIY